MTKTRDLTKGSLTGHLLYLSAPLLLGNILQQLYNTIDALIIGRFAGLEEFAAIGVAGAVMNLFLFALVGGCVGLTVAFAQYFGARELRHLRQAHFLGLAGGTAVTVLLAATGILGIPAVLSLIQTPAELYLYVADYLTIVLLGLPAAYLYNFYSALLRSVGKVVVSLIILALAVVLNLGLDIYLIAGLGLGIRGAAYATLLAQAVSAGLSYLYLSRFLPELVFSRADCRFDRRMARRLVSYSSVTALHQSGLYLGKLLVQGAVNTGGTEMISAFTAATRIETFVNSFGDSGSAATSTTVAQNYGAGSRERVRACFRASLRYLAVLGLVCSLALFLTVNLTTAFVLGQGEGAAFDSACSYLRIVALFYLFCFTGNTFAGFFEGTGRMSIPFWGAAGHITLRVILSWLFIGSFGLDAVAVATGIGWVGVNLFWYLEMKAARGN